MCFHGGEDGPHQANERKCCVSRPLSVYSDCACLEFWADCCVLISAHCQEQMKAYHQCCLWWWWWCSDTLLVTMTRFWLHSCHVPFELLSWWFLCNFIDKFVLLEHSSSVATFTLSEIPESTAQVMLSHQYHEKRASCWSCQGLSWFVHGKCHLLTSFGGWGWPLGAPLLNSAHSCVFVKHKKVEDEVNLCLFPFFSLV